MRTTGAYGGRVDYGKERRVTSTYRPGVRLPRFDINLRVVHGVLDLHMAQIDAMESFDPVQRMACWKTGFIDPGLAVQPYGIDDEFIVLPRPPDEGIVFPMSDRFAQPRWIRILKM